MISSVDSLSSQSYSSLSLVDQLKLSNPRDPLTGDGRALSQVLDQSASTFPSNYEDVFHQKQWMRVTDDSLRQRHVSANSTGSCSSGSLSPSPSSNSWNSGSQSSSPNAHSWTQFSSGSASWMSSQSSSPVNSSSSVPQQSLHHSTAPCSSVSSPVLAGSGGPTGSWNQMITSPPPPQQWNSLSGNTVSSMKDPGSPSKAQQQQLQQLCCFEPTRMSASRYKTELCRPFQENGFCKYADKCQFAHGMQELRNLARHPKYKTEPCRTFHTSGFCPYGPRCHFLHDEPCTQLDSLESCSGLGGDLEDRAHLSGCGCSVNGSMSSSGKPMVSSTTAMIDGMTSGPATSFDNNSYYPQRHPEENNNDSAVSNLTAVQLNQLMEALRSTILDDGIVGSKNAAVHHVAAKDDGRVPSVPRHVRNGTQLPLFSVPDSLSAGPVVMRSQCSMDASMVNTQSCVNALSSTTRSSFQDDATLRLPIFSQLSCK